MELRDEGTEALHWSIYPAIDLRGGRVVRLMQGDPNRETHYAEDPLQVALRWLEAGADWVHVVNLDGAFGERGADNLAALKRILVEAPALHIQFGGGLRDLASIQQALELGVSRIVLGTAAVRHPGLVDDALEMFGVQRVAVGIDARLGTVQTHGWRRGAGISVMDLARNWAERGVRWAIFTDVARDGMGQGLNLDATIRLAQVTGLNVIASGGVATLADVLQAHEAGLSGVIIGRALYAGWLTLGDALRVGQRPVSSSRSRAV